MENKYYTPEIEDIHIGYEFEIKDPEWKPVVFDPEFGGVDNPLDMIQYYLGRKELRTSFLTKKQIEAEGWELTEILVEQLGKDIFTEGFEKYHKESPEEFPKWYTLQLLEIDAIPVIDLYFKYYTNQVSQTWEHLYKGPVPTINEFRKICKLLGI